MPDQRLFDFLTPLANKEGAWVIEPVDHGSLRVGGALRPFLDALRTIPARVSGPDPRRPYRFAERGETGRLLIVWVPDE